MGGARHTEEQIAFVLRYARSGTSIGEVCRKMGVVESMYYIRRKKYGGLGVAELRRLTANLRLMEGSGSGETRRRHHWQRRC